MIRQVVNGNIHFDLENGEFVTLYPKEGCWDYYDSMTKNENHGTYNVTDGKCYIITSAYTLQSAIISVMRQEYGWCEWNELKPRRKRNLKCAGINLKMLKDAVEKSKETGEHKYLL